MSSAYIEFVNSIILKNLKKNFFCVFRIIALLERLEEAHVEPLNLCGASEGRRKQWGHQDKMAYR